MQLLRLLAQCVRPGAEIIIDVCRNAWCFYKDLMQLRSDQIMFQNCEHVYSATTR